MSKTTTLHKRALIQTSALFVFALLSQSALAGALTLDPSGRSIENVSISKSASASISDRNFNLSTVGAGLRSKKVAIVNVKVYVAQLLVTDANQYVHTADGALDSAANMTQSAIRLDFLRSVDAETVQSAFRDSLITNQVDLNDPSIKAFLDAVSAGGDASQGKALTLVLEHLDAGQEAVTYEDTNGKTTTILGGQGFIHKILSIWLGKPSDSGLSNLKKALVAGA